MDVLCKKKRDCSQMKWIFCMFPHTFSIWISSLVKKGPSKKQYIYSISSSNILHHSNTVQKLGYEAKQRLVNKDVNIQGSISQCKASLKTTNITDNTRPHILRPCFVPPPKVYSLLHRMFEHIHGVLNID